MAKSLRHVLVAIRELQRAPRNELRKAAALARAAGASLELFHSIGAPDPGAGWPETTTAATVDRQRAQIAARARQRLERFAGEEALRGLKVTCTASWDYPPHEAIVRRALATRADLVVALTRHHMPGARLLLRNTDWELIRHCPVPLLLVKTGRPYRKPTIIAAVDPFHAGARDLDARLLTNGATFARLLRGSLHVFHAYMPLVNVATMSFGAAPLVTLPPELEQAHEQQIESAIVKLAGTARVTRNRCHIRMGDVAGELRAAVRAAGADLVVMGAVSRSALARLFIGNTAERVLDGLDCDVLVVKPRGFKSRVERRAAPAPTHAPRRTRRNAAASGRSARASAARPMFTAMRVMLPPA